MFTPTSSAHHLHIAILIIFLELASTNSVDSRYNTCSSTLLSCGNIYSNIGYPFWGDGRPQYCGHPALQLQCLNSEKGYHAILKMSLHDEAPYSVPNMKISHNNITLKLQGFQDTPCVSYKKGFTDVFKISPTVENITLLHDCPAIDAHPRNFHGSVPCSADTDAYYLKNTTARKEYESCSSFEVPVFRKQLDIYNKGIGGLTNLLHQGFEVIYEYSSECLNCNSSRGICGSSLQDLDFECLHKDEASDHKVHKSGGKWKLILEIGIPAGLLILLALNIGICYYQKFRLRSSGLLSRIISTNPTLDLETGGSFNGIPVFPFSELQEATNNFDENKELGDGGFGVVYYGKLRDGREVAVKRLYEKNYKQVGQFKNEVEILTLLRHPNLVTLYGCTSRHSRELLLVYEYISNGTVADHLHGDRSESEALTWAIRMKIAIETASALSYLHTSDIIHRDVKTNNILLTETFSVKVADFGLSRLFPVDATHVSTVPQGTPGYLDPDYHKCYQVTNKSDVYSFGVVLVELISSLPAVDIGRQEDEINLSDYAVNRIRKGVIYELVDQNLGYKSDFKVRRMVTLVAELAFRCLQQEKEVRPNMNEVLETLVQINELDYETLEAEEMDEKRTSVAIDDDIEHPPPSPSSDNWAVKSTTPSNPSG